MGVVASIISKEPPQAIVFPIVWVLTVCFIVGAFIVTSRVVTIREGAIYYKVFNNETVIPFDTIKSISGGVRRIPNIPLDIFISIVFEDDSSHIKTIKFLQKSDGYKWNKEHEMVDELRRLSNK
jgi:hypothetical protein